MNLELRLTKGMPFHPVNRLGGVFGLLVPFIVFCSAAFAQQPTCNVTSTPYVAAAEGLSEATAPLTFSCVGGTSGTVVSSNLYISLNTGITNRISPSGAPANVSVTVNTGAGPVGPAVVVQFSGSSTLIINQLQYQVPAPNTTPVTIQISGIRANVAKLAAADSTALVTAQVLDTGFVITNQTSQVPIAVAVGQTLLSSVQNNGFPCSGSTLPAGSFGFQDLINAGTASSSLRLTEGNTTAFASKAPGADAGMRFLVSLSNYSNAVSVFVPNYVVGGTGVTSSPTSSGAFNGTPSGGIYTPGAGQLTLQLITGTDATGAGGTPASAPGSIQNLSAVTQLTLTGGAAYAVYEVVDSNVNTVDTVQIPVFVAGPATACIASAQSGISVALAPASTVSVATTTDPIPRFVAGTPGPDCQIFGDCNALTPPRISVDKTSVQLTGSSQGNVQVGNLVVSNGGQGDLTYSISVSYQTGSGWLTVSPGSGLNTTTLSLTADPGALDPGVYQAIVKINSGAYGAANIPVTFTVGPVGVTIKAIVSAATFATGAALAPNSYASIFGVNLGGSVVSVTVAGVTCTSCISYAGPSQVNFLIPQSAALSLVFGGYTNVTLTVDGKTSNTYAMPLALNAPGVFTPGIANQDGSVNLPGHPTAQNQIVAIYMTGLAAPSIDNVTVKFGTQPGVTTLYAGPAPGIPGMEQVNVRMPAGLTPVNGAVPVSVCLAQSTGQPLCSPAVSLYVQ